MPSKRYKPPTDRELLEFCKVLAAATAPADVIPPGWATLDQIAEAMGINRQKVARHLHLIAGQWERRNFRIKCDKIVRHVTHYRLKK
jgi:hypothetical protein